jgi:hypothetical protein
MNSDLTAKLQANDVIRNGLMNNPKCIAAMQLLQSNPKEAQSRYQNDPEVVIFITEFSKIMAEHFTALGEKQAKTNNSVSTTATTQTSSLVEEMGPLQYQATMKHKQQLAKSSNAAVNSSPAKSSNTDDVEAKRVEEILKNDELRAMLMDPNLQKILQECGDPIKFQYYMRDPVISKKIKILFDNGLAGVAK